MTDVEKVRALCQDVPVQAYNEEVICDGTETIFQLTYSPVIESTLSFVGSSVPAYTLDPQTGLVTFASAPSEQTIKAKYKHTALTDEAIETYLELESDDLRLAAALALDAMASSEAIIQKKIKSLDLQTDGPAVANALRKHAETLRDEAADPSAWEIADQINDIFGWREKIVKDILKESF